MFSLCRMPCKLFLRWSTMGHYMWYPSWAGGAITNGKDYPIYRYSILFPTFKKKVPNHQPDVISQLSWLCSTTIIYTDTYHVTQFCTTIAHDGSMVLLYMLTWTPSIYPLYVSIYVPAPWIRHGLNRIRLPADRVWSAGLISPWRGRSFDACARSSSQPSLQQRSLQIPSGKLT